MPGSGRLSPFTSLALVEIPAMVNVAFMAELGLPRNAPQTGTFTVPIPAYFPDAACGAGRVTWSAGRGEDGAPESVTLLAKVAHPWPGPG